MWYHLVDKQLLAIARVLHLHLVVHSAIQSVEAGREVVIVSLVAAHEHVALAERIVSFAGLEGGEVAGAAGPVVQARNVAWRHLHWGVHEVARLLGGMLSRIALLVLCVPIANVDAATELVAEQGIEVDNFGCLRVDDAQSNVPIVLAGRGTAGPADIRKS